MSAPIYGKKTILFEIEPADLPQMVRIHRADREGYMMRFSLKDMTDQEALKYLAAMLMTREIAGWSVYTKHGRKSTCIGFAYLSDVTEHTATLSGIMDRAAVKGLGRDIREGRRYTFAEDVSRALIRHCFEKLGFNRLETMVRADNRRAIVLDRKVGWKIEGTLREAYQNNGGEPRDVVVLGILRKEWANEQQQ